MDMDVEETAEEVLKDLQSLDFAELRLMCVHRSLSTDGDKTVLLHRLKSFFGFEVEPLESEITDLNGPTEPKRSKPSSAFFETNDSGIGF